MEEKITGILGKDEQLLWAGRPQFEKTMVAPYRSKLQLRWLICLALAIAVCVWFFTPSATASASEGTITGMFIVVLALIAIGAVRPFVDKRTLDKKVVYAVTNMRLLLIHDNNLGPEIKIEMLRSNSGEKKYLVNPDGTMTIVVGSAVGRKVHKYRMLGTFGNRADEVPGLVFYRISEGKRVQQLLASDPLTYVKQPIQESSVVV